MSYSVGFLKILPSCWVSRHSDLQTQNTWNQNGQSQLWRCLTNSYPGPPCYWAKIYAFEVPLKPAKHGPKTFGQKLLSRGERRKIFDPGLMNKLHVIRMEWVSDYVIDEKNQHCLRKNERGNVSKTLQSVSTLLLLLGG